MTNDKEKLKANCARYYLRHKDEIKLRSKIYYEKNKPKIKEWYKERMKDEDVKKKKAQYQKQYLKNNRNKTNEKRRNYWKKTQRKKIITGVKVPKRGDALKVLHAHLEELKDACTLYWIVRERAAITRYLNRRKRYRNLRKDFEDIQRMKKAA